VQARHSGAADLRFLTRNAAMTNPPDSDLLRRIEAATMNLPRREREIFMNHRMHNLSYCEIAERTGLTVRQVERHMAKALYKLTKQMDGRKLSWWERWF
jgi:RNA polymerase sigma-70 factor (ECF subfamily)